VVAARSHRRGIAQPGSAGVLGTPGRRFKSCCPDQQVSVIVAEFQSSLARKLTHRRGTCCCDSPFRRCRGGHARIASGACAPMGITSPESAGEGRFQTLSHRVIHALAGRWYVEFVGAREACSARRATGKPSYTLMRTTRTTWQRSFAPTVGYRTTAMPWTRPAGRALSQSLRNDTSTPWLCWHGVPIPCVAIDCRGRHFPNLDQAARGRGTMWLTFSFILR
jgi:hypothetical protein